MFDFSFWTLKHPGGAARIRQWAEQGLDYLDYPASSHGMRRWLDNRDQLPYLGLRGERVDFSQIPSISQSQAIYV